MQIVHLWQISCRLSNVTQELFFVFSKSATVCVDCDGHHLLPAVGGHLDQLLLNAHVQHRLGPVLTLYCPKKTPFLVVLLPSPRLEPQCCVLLQDVRQLVVCGEDGVGQGHVLPHSGVESSVVLDGTGDWF